MDMTTEEEFKLNKRFADGLRLVREKFPEAPELDLIENLSSQYIALINKTGVTDNSVVLARFTVWIQIYNFVVSLILFIISLLFTLPGWILTSWLNILINQRAEKERKVALSKSSVKLTGRDVVSSFRMLYGVICFPILTATLSLLSFLLITYYYGLYDGFWCTCYLVLIWPIYCYVGLKFADTFVINLSRLTFNARSLFSGHKISQIIQLRRELQIATRNFVDAFGPKVFKDFEKTRVVQRNSYDKETRLDELMIDAFGCLDDIGI
jgi:glycerol-3-phosphate O-acyltransferase/dihydroxyacetone phosphate acyltransferase